MQNRQFQNVELTNIWKNLKSKNAQVQEESSVKLYEYLQKHSEETDDIFDELRMKLESQKKEEKFGILVALNRILNISRETQIVHYVNKLIPVMLNQLLTNNMELVEKGAECLGNLAEAGGSITAEVIDTSLNRAIMWLESEMNPKSTDIKKYSAVLVLREFCKKLPVITFNKLFGPEKRYNLVFQAFKDTRVHVRATAAEVINECIKQINERTLKRGTVAQSSAQQTQMIYKEVEKAFEMDDINYQHSALSVLSALISSKGTSQEIIQKSKKRDGKPAIQNGTNIVIQVMRLLDSSKSPLVRKKCIELIPSMYKYITKHFQISGNLDTAMRAIFAFIEQPGNKDRGQGYISLGKMSILVDAKLFVQHLDKILKLIEAEVKPPPRARDNTLKPIVDLDSLTCIRYLLRNFGPQIIQQVNMNKLINDIFYSGYNKQVIECLSEISRINRGEYKRAAQIKLLNSCSIILTGKRNKFPMELEENFMQTPQQDTNRESISSQGNSGGAQTARVGDERDSLTQSNGSIARFGGPNASVIDNRSSVKDFNNSFNSYAQSPREPTIKSKNQIEKFYTSVLNKDNQKFLLELVKQSSMPQSDGSNVNGANQGATEKTQMVTLALRTLSNFDFEAFAMCIVYFIENSVLGFLDDENPQVRKEAMQTCCSLSFPQTSNLRIGAGMERIINKLLHRFFVTATTDNEDRIRVTMLKYLNPQFDPFISRYENLLMLFNCMQDQNFEIKERTVRILGRLVPHNASQILPYLRQLIVSLISQLEQSNDSKEREEAVKLIKMFVKSAPDLARAYSTSILSCLIKKLELENEPPTSAFVSAILNVISEISKINSEAIKPYLGQLFPLILECIKDLSAKLKRQMAIQTLISIIENTGFVVKPYFYFPEILSTITNLVQTEQQPEIRKLIFRLIGTLGAVDPYLVKQIRLSSEQSDAGDVPESMITLSMILPEDANDEGMKNKKVSTNASSSKSKKHAKQDSKSRSGKSSQSGKGYIGSLVTVEELNLSKENKYPAMAIYQLLKVLVDPNLRDHHKVCLDGIKYLVRNQPNCMPFMPMLIPPLMNLMKANDPYLTNSLFDCVNMIIVYIPQAMLEFADPIFDMLHIVIHLQPNLVIKLLAEINKRYKAKLFSHMYLMLPQVLSLIEHSRKIAEQNHLSYNQDISMQKTRDLIQITREAVYHLPMFDYQILDDHLYLIVPLLLRTASHVRITPEFQDLNKVAIKTLNSVVNCSTFREHTAQVVHQLLRLLDNLENESSIVDDIINSFCNIAIRLTSDFAPYTSLIQKAIRRNRLQDRCGAFDHTIQQITKLDPIEQFLNNLEMPSLEDIYAQANEAFNLNLKQMTEEIKIKELRVKQKINTADLLREFSTDKCHIADDWTDWLTKTSHQLLKQNPSPVLFVSSTLTEVYSPLAAELYNIAFVSCWKNMRDNEKQEIMDAFMTAIKSKSKTTQVLQTILNLAEFMELDESTDIKLFSSKTLAEIAEKCDAYAKALYYWEQEFDNSPRETIELLIQTNYGLQQPEAAEGILEYAKKNLLAEENHEWLEKLKKWPEALKMYQKQLGNATTTQKKIEAQKGKLNCYKNLMNYKEFSQLVKQMWNEHLVTEDPATKTEIRNLVKSVSPDVAYAAWNLSNWDSFKLYVRHMDEEAHPYERSFYNAVLEIKQKQYSKAIQYIDKSREYLDDKISSLLSESYNRAYFAIQELQFLKELEEVIEYKRTMSEEKKETLYRCWVARQKSMPTQDLEAHQKLLNIRCLVLDKKEEIDNFIQFAKMAQDSGNRELSNRVLISLKKELEQAQKDLHIQENKQTSALSISFKEEQQKLTNKLAKVQIAIYQSLYNQGKFEEATDLLEQLLQETKDIEPSLLSVCYQKLGAWQFEHLQSDNKLQQQEDAFVKIVTNCEKATQINSLNIEGWHYYSTTNYEASVFQSKRFQKELAQDQTRNSSSIFFKPSNSATNQTQAQKASKKTQQFLLHREFGFNNLAKIINRKGVEKQKWFIVAKQYVTYISAAVKGLIQQLSLSSQINNASTTKNLQTTLRLLKIWFQHGNLEEIQEHLKRGFDRIDLKVWIEVIPQLLARIDIGDNMIKQTLIDLVEKISMKFPQALIYSLSVTQKSNTTGRREAAEQLIEKLKTTQPILIEQATIISNELNRSAILLSEVWQEAIEEASRIYFGRNDGKAMYAYLQPFHQQMEKEPETMNEISFYQGYASDLLDAYSWMKRFTKTENFADINQAWDIYYSIFRKISTKQKEVQFYELRNVAPKLLASENLDIAVPGTFRSNKKIIKIAKFASVLPVLASKQHPRKMHMHGNDGREYLFLLKGHEDIRQDERVMQLFGLVNTLLALDQQTSKKDLSIRRYPVIPLSQNTGLIGWVQNCDTLHILIKDHREDNNIIPNIEYKLMEQMCEHFETCPLPNKVEIFRNALEKTLGEDLQKVLWVKSQNSEVWLDRRTNYTRSLAVMSMVGYILGLGDRHPSNIMLERYTGKIVHIDFGDCFEIAMRREKFPEKIPFRLTRMLIRAMEVSGIEGNFRTTCENTMRVMRDRKESILAIMEAFVYDPLISFRLLNPKMFKKDHIDQHGEDEDDLKKQAEVAKPKDQSDDIVAEIEKNKQAAIREQIVENVLDRLQGQTGRKLAESKFSRRVEDMELMQIMQQEEEDVRQKELNYIAEIVIMRIYDKLRGSEFHNPNKPTDLDGAQSQAVAAPRGFGVETKQSTRKDVPEQVDILIKQATDHENLSSCYIGWCPYW